MMITNSFPTIDNIFRDLWHNASTSLMSFHSYGSSDIEQHLQIQKQAKKKICLMKK